MIRSAIPTSPLRGPGGSTACSGSATGTAEADPPPDEEPLAEGSPPVAALAVEEEPVGAGDTDAGGSAALPASRAPVGAQAAVNASTPGSSSPAVRRPRMLLPPRGVRL